MEEFNVELEISGLPEDSKERMLASRFLVNISHLRAKPPLEMPEKLASCAEVNGFSTPAILSLIHTAVRSMPEDGVYCEIGVFQGRSARAAIAARRAEQKIVLVDDFREIQYYPGADQSARMLDDGMHVFFHQMECFHFLRTYLGKPWSVFYYDAGHSFQDTYTALALGRHKLADDALVFVDDTNWGEVRNGVMLAVQDFGYKVVLDLSTPCNGYRTWWNGFMALQWTGGAQ